MDARRIFQLSFKLLGPASPGLVNKLLGPAPRSWLSTIALFGALTAAGWASEPLSDSIRVETFPSHSRLLFRTEENVPVEWKETDGGFEMLFKGLSFSDLGAPLGDEQTWVENFQKTLKDPRLASVELKEVAGGLTVVGRWRFDIGPQGPAEKKMETFDYRQKEPGLFIVDFWVKKGPTVAEMQAEQIQKNQAAKVKKAKVAIQAKVTRKIASQKAKSDLDDLERFCKQPLDDSKDVFLPFLPVVSKIAYEKYLPQSSPDQDYRYFEPQEDPNEKPEENKDARYVRLALKLYREQKFALAIRTIEFMQNEQPKSPYIDEMKFLRANALIKLGANDEAFKQLNQMKTEQKGRPTALYAALYLAGKTLEKKDPLATYEAFSWLATYYPDTRWTWLFHLGTAEALAAIRQTEQAAKEYDWVAENAPTSELKAQGALRLGDLYLDRRQYAQALNAYSRGLKYFKHEAASFPPIHLNRGETLYGLGEYEDARKVFQDYVDKYGGYPDGWRATFRLGEIFGRRAGAENEAESRRWFFETINRFPLSAGATLARLRLLPCGDHGGFTYESAVHFFEKSAREFDASDQISMVKYPEFRALSQVRSYVTLNHHLDAIDVVQQEMSVAKSTLVKSELGRLFEGLFRRNILALLDEGKPYEALHFYEERSKYRASEGELRRGMSATDPDYLLRLSLAASQLRLGKLAATLAAEYRSMNDVNRSIADVGKKGTSGESSADLDAQLKVSEQKFAEARALWIEGDTEKGSEQGLKNAEKIRADLEQVRPESPFSFQKEIILGLLEERHEKLKTALDHALKAQILIPMESNSKSIRMRIVAWAASLESKAGNLKDALGMYKDLEAKIRSEKKPEAPEVAEPASDVAAVLGVPAVPTLEQTVIAEGEILSNLKQWGEAAAVYAKAVDEGLGGNQAIYGYARSLLNTGEKSEKEKAISTLEKLSESKTDDFWKRLATETLADLKIRKQ